MTLAFVLPVPARAESNLMDDLIFIVEDDPASARLLEMALEDEARVEIFSKAEDCLERIEAVLPVAFFLDVNLPGIDGFELCRRLREHDRAAEIPVIFVSGHVGIDARVQGYEVGAHDFIFKPLDVTELRTKTSLLLKTRRERASLENQLEETDMLTSLVLSNMDEYAVLLKYLRALNSCLDEHEIAQLTHDMLRGFGLSGGVQLRLPGETLTTTAHGPASPIIVSIIGHVRHMGRIFEFRKHGVYNFERITLIIDNMPISDPERCGRLRDHLAIAIETADARLAGLLATRTNALADSNLQQTLSILQASISELSTHHDQAQEVGNTIMSELLDELRIVFSHLGMNLLQEESILDLVEQSARRLIRAIDANASTQAAFSALQAQMNAMRQTLRT